MKIHADSSAVPAWPLAEAAAKDHSMLKCRRVRGARPRAEFTQTDVDDGPIAPQIAWNSDRYSVPIGRISAIPHDVRQLRRVLALASSVEADFETQARSDRVTFAWTLPRHPVREGERPPQTSSEAEMPEGCHLVVDGVQNVMIAENLAEVIDVVSGPGERRR